MTPGADVASIPALRDWLGAIATYQSEAAESLSGINMEVRRSFEWVAEQLSLWQRAIRVCEDEVVQAKADLAAKKFPNWDGRMPDTTVEERNLRRAKARLEHAQERVQSCRSWIGRLPKHVEEIYAAHGHRLQNFLDGDLTRGVALLARRVDALERYADLKTDFSSAPSALPPSSSGGAAS